MKAVLTLAALAAMLAIVEPKYNPPKVQVYSVGPGEFGKENHLVCHVSHFHPPDISIQLVQDEKQLPGTDQTDLAFNPDWHFHLTKDAVFTPADGAKVACRVIHNNSIRDYAYVPNM